MVKMAIFGASKWPELISRKFQVEENSWNFHMCIPNQAAKVCIIDNYTIVHSVKELPV